METLVTQDGSEYVVNGVKCFCTMTLGASQYMVWCALDGGTDMGTSLFQVLVPADAPRISTDGKCDTLRMRATFSSAVSFKELFRHVFRPALAHDHLRDDSSDTE